MAIIGGVVLFISLLVLWGYQDMQYGENWLIAFWPLILIGIFLVKLHLENKNIKG